MTPAIITVRWSEVEWAPRCHTGQCLGVDGRLRHGGQFMPFYVPRHLMPQVDEADYSALLQFARDNSVTVEEGETEPLDFCAHQRVSMDRIDHMTPEILAKRILSSQDKFVLDGNHRWTAHVIRRQSVGYYSFGLPFAQALDFLMSFPRTFRLGDGPQPERN